MNQISLDICKVEIVIISEFREIEKLYYSLLYMKKNRRKK